MNVIKDVLTALTILKIKPEDINKYLPTGVNMEQTPPPPPPSKEEVMEATDAVPHQPIQEEEYNQPDPQPEPAQPLQEQPEQTPNPNPTPSTSGKSTRNIVLSQNARNRNKREQHHQKKLHTYSHQGMGTDPDPHLLKNSSPPRTPITSTPKCGPVRARNKQSYIKSIYKRA